MEKLIHCSRISVDCVENDPVDVRSGGPEYLGFDFNVRKEEVEEMKLYISETLNKYGVPFLALFSYKELDVAEENVWTKERIHNAIKKDANYLRNEASRHYSRRMR